MGSLIDEILRDAMSRGEFDNLPGTGKKLALPDDQHTPDDLKMAHKLLKDNDLAPAWISEGKALEEWHEVLVARLQRASVVDAALADEVKRYNSAVLSFNLKLPRGIAHRAMLNIARVRANKR